MSIRILRFSIHFPIFFEGPRTLQVFVRESQIAFWESETLNPASGKNPVVISTPVDRLLCQSEDAYIYEGHLEVRSMA